ncbi:MAG: four helix bundle protein [Bacteroidetes bacterium]|nr:four helix bundle protein [Bacteroidota bacterium]
MKIQDFEDLRVWQLSQKLSLEIYSITSKLTDWGFRDQVRRASVSISCNIAEGFGRPSKKEYIRYLVIAKGSLFEVRSILHLGKGLNYYDQDTYLRLIQYCRDLEKMTWGLIKHLKQFQ